MDDALSRALKKKDCPRCVLTARRSIRITTICGDQSSIARKSMRMDDLEMQEFEARVTQRVREEMMEEMNSKLDALVQEILMTFAVQFGIQIPNQTRINVR